MSVEKRARFYVGISGPSRQVFSSRERPTPETFPTFGAAIGPFKTKAGANFMRDNPLCESISAAERNAKGG